MNFTKRNMECTWHLFWDCIVSLIHWYLIFRYMQYALINCIKQLTHWGRVTHLCVGYLIIIGSDNSLSPGRRQAIIRSNAGILLIRTLGTNFSEILSKIHTFSFKKVHFKMSYAKWRPFCLGLNVLIPFSNQWNPQIIYRHCLFLLFKICPVIT